MLQSSVASMELFENSGFSDLLDGAGAPPVPGAALQESARGLSAALSRLESLLAGRRDRDAGAEGALMADNQRLIRECTEMEEENARLRTELAEAKTRSAAEAKQQVAALSERLDALIARLARVLEE